MAEVLEARIREWFRAGGGIPAELVISEVVVAKKYNWSKSGCVNPVEAYIIAYFPTTGAGKIVEGIYRATGVELKPKVKPRYHRWWWDPDIHSVSIPPQIIVAASETSARDFKILDLKYLEFIRQNCYRQS